MLPRPLAKRVLARQDRVHIRQQDENLASFLFDDDGSRLVIMVVMMFLPRYFCRCRCCCRHRAPRSHIRLPSQAQVTTSFPRPLPQLKSGFCPRIPTTSPHLTAPQRGDFAKTRSDGVGCGKKKKKKKDNSKDAQWHKRTRQLGDLLVVFLVVVLGRTSRGHLMAWTGWGCPVYDAVIFPANENNTLDGNSLDLAASVGATIVLLVEKLGSRVVVLVVVAVMVVMVVVVGMVVIVATIRNIKETSNNTQTNNTQTNNTLSLLLDHLACDTGIRHRISRSK
ncbi:hypothetical protein BD289DRAFT_434589 [Coniella lustricola]|uniref:Uncharacterized protein n=1 Tax=Coniella lustricola TaxID=2025994 RepID=A0A2T3A7A3_9PEZI|nr:hypothetical protein BD289DRAFT_434589 [Coniella lustricola]